MKFQKKIYLIQFHINCFQITPLYAAVQKGNAKIVECLVNSDNIDPNIYSI